MTVAYPNLYTCQLSNKKLLGGETPADTRLTSTQKKSAETVRLELDFLPTHTSVDRIVIIAFTFANPVPDRRTIEQRYSELRNRLLQKLFKFGITIFDCSSSGRPHFHIIAVGSETANYRGFFDFQSWHASRAAEKRWRESGYSDDDSESLWRELSAKYSASATPGLRALWGRLRTESQNLGFGRVNALPIENPLAYDKYLAECVTDVFRQNHPDDKGHRHYRYWGKFPRKVNGKFYRITKGATRWRGKLAFCGHILGFTDFGDFAKCFGPRWFIYLKGIIQSVPAEIAEASLLTKNLPQQLLQKHRQKIIKIETELLDRQERFGQAPAFLTRNNL